MLSRSRQFLAVVAVLVALTLSSVTAAVRAERVYRSIPIGQGTTLCGPGRKTVKLYTWVDYGGVRRYEWQDAANGMPIVPQDSGTGDQIVFDTIWMSYYQGGSTLNFSYVWPDWLTCES